MCCLLAVGCVLCVVSFLPCVLASVCRSLFVARFCLWVDRCFFCLLVVACRCLFLPFGVIFVCLICC